MNRTFAALFACLLATAEAGERKSAVRREPRTSQVVVGATATLVQLKEKEAQPADDDDDRDSVSIGADGQSEKLDDPTWDKTTIGDDGDDGDDGDEDDSDEHHFDDGSTDEPRFDDRQHDQAEMQVFSNAPLAVPLNAASKADVPDESMLGEVPSKDFEDEDAVEDEGEREEDEILDDDDGFNKDPFQDSNGEEPMQETSDEGKPLEEEPDAEQGQQATDKNGMLTSSGKEVLHNAVAETTEVLRKSRQEDERQRQRLLGRVNKAEEAIRHMEAEMQIAHVLEDGVKAQVVKIHDLAESALGSLQVDDDKSVKDNSEDGVADGAAVSLHQSGGTEFGHHPTGGEVEGHHHIKGKVQGDHHGH